VGHEDAEHSPARGEVAPVLDSLGGILARADGNFNREGGGQGRRFQPTWVRGLTLGIWAYRYRPASGAFKFSAPESSGFRCKH